MIHAALAGLDGIDLRDYRVPGYRGRRIEPRAVLVHHTASRAGSGDLPSLGTCIHGRADLPGPLCQVLIGRAGTVAVITDGYGNHAGRGHWPGITAGNEQLVGVELENDGVGEPWTAGLYNIAVTVVARLCDALGVDLVLGHKEWSTTGKIDPSFDMDRFRGDVAATRAGHPSAPSEEDHPMSTTDRYADRRPGTPDNDPIYDFAHAPAHGERRGRVTCDSKLLIRQRPASGESKVIAVWCNGEPRPVEVPGDGRPAVVEVWAAGLVSVGYTGAPFPCWPATGMVAEHRELWYPA